MLFIDYSSAFNTSLYNWILDFLMGRPQAVRVGNNTSATLIHNTRPPQESLLSHLLNSKLTRDSMASQHACTIKSILTGCITAWYGNCSASDHKAQCVWPSTSLRPSFLQPRT